MKYRMLIVLMLVIGFAGRSHAQSPPLNCTHGSYWGCVSGDCPYQDNGCNNTITITKHYNEQCAATQTTASGATPGEIYWTNSSSATGTGEHNCNALTGFDYKCPPYMYMYEVDGGLVDPNSGQYTSSDYNRFYNQAYNVHYTGGSNPCQETGVWYNGFSQCPTQACAGSGYGSPIIIDIGGTGFALTNAQNGVMFDITGTGQPIQIAWTATGANNAFLCLPDSSGGCDDGKDLFGNFTPQPKSATPNGFAALSVYDQPTNGGNGDGVIDSRDAIFSKLRLWIDANHDGVSQPNEVFTLSQLGITSISLNYKWDQRKDQYGNVFRYRAAVGSTSGAGRVAYDVFLVTAAATTAALKACPRRLPMPPEEKTLLK